MTNKPVSSRPDLRRWPFPELDPPPDPPSVPSPPIEDFAVDDAATAERGDSGPVPSVADAVEEQVARGYAEGWERGRAEGRERGHAEGIGEATRAAQTKLTAEAQRLAAIIARLTAPITALERSVEEAVVALALEVARCVIGHETSRSREYLVPLIREAVAKVPIEMGSLKIVLNPADLDLIRELAPEIEGGGAALVGDDAIEPGDCRVVADSQGAPIKDMRWRPRAAEGMSQIDLSLATRWRAVMLALFEGEDR